MGEEVPNHRYGVRSYRGIRSIIVGETIRVVLHRSRVNSMKLVAYRRVVIDWQPFSLIGSSPI